MKYIILLLTVTFSWTQCDANGDGILNVLDIVQLVNLILFGPFGR